MPHIHAQIYWIYLLPERRERILNLNIHTDYRELKIHMYQFFHLEKKSSSSSLYKLMHLINISNLIKAFLHIHFLSHSKLSQGHDFLYSLQCNVHTFRKFFLHLKAQKQYE